MTMTKTVTASLVGATDYMLKYKLVSTGTGYGVLDANGGVSPDLKTDSIKGTPLHELLSKVYTNTAAARAVLASGNVEVFMQPGTVHGGNWTIDASEVGGAFEMNLVVYVAELVGAYLYIKFRHSVAR